MDIEDFSGEKYSAVQDYERLSGRTWIEKNYSTSLSDNQLHFIARNCLRYECHPESKIPLVYTIPKNKYSKKTLLSELHIDFKLISSCNNEFDIIDKIVKLK